MAFENAGPVVSFNAQAAMTETDYRFVKTGTLDTDVVVCGAGGKAIGIRRNSPAINKPVEIVFYGIAKLTLGGTVTKDAWIISDAAGAGVASTTDKAVVRAQALSAGVSGDVISVLICNFTLSAT